MSLSSPIIGLAEVSAAIESALARVETQFEQTLRSDLPPVQELVEHVESYRGKMLRPMLVMLCGMAAAAPTDGSIPAITDEHVLIATVCEMVHMATLVHDDVLDAAETRRKGLTVNRLRGNEAAVILGDYLFSSAYTLCCTLPTPRAALLIGQTGVTLCTGELLQLHHRDNLSIDEPTYFELIRRKTASLIGVACRLGALASGASEAEAVVFDSMGSDLGLAFQIQDDLLDLTGNEEVVGKPLRRDLQLGKLTLPIIHHLRVAGAKQRGRTLETLERLGASTPGGGGGLARELQHYLEGTGSIQHAHQTARSLVERAKRAIESAGESPARRALCAMADQVVSRTY